MRNLNIISISFYSIISIFYDSDKKKIVIQQVGFVFLIKGSLKYFWTKYMFRLFIR